MPFGLFKKKKKKNKEEQKSKETLPPKAQPDDDEKENRPPSKSTKETILRPTVDRSQPLMAPSNAAGARQRSMDLGRKPKNVDKTGANFRRWSAQQERSETTQVHAKKIKRVTHKLGGAEFKVFHYYQPTGKVLGRGAYAVVAEFYDLRSGKKVAIKKNHGVFNDLADAKRILREIKLLIHLRNHPDVCRILDVIPPTEGEYEKFDNVYIVMEFMDMSLGKVIRRSQQQLSERHYQYFIYQLLRGMKYIHTAGIVHRDLKPDNLLVNKSDCNLKVTDFGLSRGICLDDEKAKMTEYVVTRYYRAPEVMLSARYYGKPVDVWSVGCIFAELFVKKPFFKGSNHIDQLKKIFQVRGKPEESNIEWMKSEDARQWVKHLDKSEYPGQSLKKIFPMLSEGALDLLEQMLQINPSTRITIQGALEHPWLTSLHKPDEEPSCPEFNIEFEYEKAIKTEFGLRHMMYEELWKFHDTQHAKTQERRARKTKAREAPDGAKRTPKAEKQASKGQGALSPRTAGGKSE